MKSDTIERSMRGGLATRLRRPGAGSKIAALSKDRTMPPEKQPDKTRYSGRLALRIRAERKAKGMSVDDLARAVSAAGFRLATSSLYGWENGSRDPALDALPYLAKALRVSLSDLLPSK